MTKSELLARLEAATEGSEELDLDIAEFLKGRRPGTRETYTPFTRSLDAALTLVPEGWNWNLMGPDVLKSNPAIALLGLPGQREELGKSATFALALCIAALKARTE